MVAPVDDADCDLDTAAFTDHGRLVNSGEFDGLLFDDAFDAIAKALADKDLGRRVTNYRLRDAVFSRQRYWGEPFPVYYKNGMPQMIDEQHLPLTLPEVEK